MYRPNRRRGRIWIALGLLLIVAALGLTAYNVWADRQAGDRAYEAVLALEEQIPTLQKELVAAKNEQSLDSPASITPADRASDDPEIVEDVPEEALAAPEIPEYVLNPEMEMPVAIVDGLSYVGLLTIPALELELPVISQWNEANLNIAPCSYSGSVYLDDFVICGHNYTAHFGNIKDLRPGDTITFTDMDGNAFHYEVLELETLLPTAIGEMTSGDWDLTLFTCTIGGQSRLAVRCEKYRDPEWIW